MVILLVCLCLSCSIGIYANAAGNVKNVMFHFGGNSGWDTDREYKANNSRTYVIYSDGLSAPTVTVMGVGGGKRVSCSKAIKLKEYTEYTIKNTVYGNYDYAALHISADGTGSGFWSPDSSRNYTNVG